MSKHDEENGQIYQSHDRGLDLGHGETKSIAGMDVVRDDNGDLVFSKPKVSNFDNIPFNANLAEHLDQSVLSKIGNSLMQEIQDDWNSAEEWRQILAEGIKQLGLRPERKDKPYPGASNVYSSAYKDAALTFLSSATAELLPSGGYSDTKIIGKTSPDIDAAALRFQTFLNQYLGDDYKDYTPQKERTFLWTVIAGSCFTKVYQDPTSTIARPLVDCIKPEDMIINYGAKSIQSAARKTVVLRMADRELKSLQKARLYTKTKLAGLDSSRVDEDIVTDILDQIDGRDSDETSGGFSKNYIMWECYKYIDLNDYLSGSPSLDVDRDSEYAPYVITMEKDSGKIIGLYRNWKEDDQEKQEKQIFVQHTYLPGFGIYGLGLAHIASNTAAAAATIKRLCIDASIMSSLPGGFKVKGTKQSENDIILEPNVFKNLDTGTIPLPQAFSSPPFQPPNPIVKQIGDDLESNIMNMSSINEQKIADFNQNAPASTTIALLEQSHRLQSSIIKRLHRAMGEEFELIADIFAKHLSDDATYPFEMGEDSKFPIKQDLMMPFKIIPISDPNNNSSFLRIVKAEGTLQTVLQCPNPDLFDMHEAYYRYLSAIGTSDIDKILKNPQKLQEEQEQQTVISDPLAENIAFLMGTKIKIEKGQNHDAHIMSHNDVAQGLDPATQSDKILEMKIHIMSHERAKYIENIEHTYGVQIELEGPISIDIQNMIAEQEAGALQEKTAHLPPPPLDPTMVMKEDVEVKRLATQNKARYEHEKNQVELQKAEMKAEVDTEKIRAELAKAGIYM